MKTNRKYKDSVFTKLFGHDEKIILELYNAIQDTDYDERTPIEIATLDDVLFLDWLNDIAFVIDGKLVVLIEHQSTINNNMPLRMLLYIARVYEKICDPKSIYRTKKMEIPAPEFVVLYNGKDKMPDHTELRLSDMFKKHGVESPINLDLKVQVYNINKGRNPEFAKRSTTLAEYEIFVAEVRKNEKTLPLKKAIVKAIKDCVEDGVLREFLKKYSSEVINMLFREFSVEDAKKLWLDEGYQEGILKGSIKGKAEGKAEGMQLVLSVLQQQGYDIAEIKSKLPKEFA